MKKLTFKERMAEMAQEMIKKIKADPSILIQP